MLEYGKYGVLTDNNQESLYKAVENFLLNIEDTKKIQYQKDPMKDFLININKLMEEI